MKNLKNLGQALSKSEQKNIVGGITKGPVPNSDCSTCSNGYGNWLYTSLAGGPIGPGAPCGYFAGNGDRCNGTVTANSNSCCA